MVKVVTVLIFLLVGLLVDVGAMGDEKHKCPYGFENRKKGDAPRAMNGTIWRIVLFFVGAIFIMDLFFPKTIGTSLILMA
jgi:amino acid permease